MSIQHDGFSYDVERSKGGLTLSRRDHCSGEIIQYPISAEQGEDLCKQLKDALKDPLEGLGLPWEWNISTPTKTGGTDTTVSEDHLILRTFCALSDAEQREFLMRGLAMSTASHPSTGVA